MTQSSMEISQLRSKPSKKAVMEQKIKEAVRDRDLLEAKETKNQVTSSNANKIISLITDKADKTQFASEIITHKK